MSVVLLLPLLIRALLLAVGQEPAGPDAVTRARALVVEGAHDQALQVLEAGIAARPSDAGLHRALAETLERYVDGGGSWLAMSDARDAWDRAHALAPADPEIQRGRIGVRLRLGEYAEAQDLAERALGAAWLTGGQAPAALLELACRARLGALPAREASSPEARAAALATAWAALRNARTLAGDATELVRLAAGLLDAEGLSESAATELVAGIERVPTASELHRALIDLYAREGLEERLSALYERWSAAGTNATLAWFTGYAWRLGGDLALRERRCVDALEAYDRCTQWMGVAATLEPGFRATADAVRFQAEVASVWAGIEASDAEPERLAAAGERALALLRAHLARRDEPDGLGRSLMHALAALGERRIADNDFAQAAVEARAVVTQLPGEGPWWNNLGFVLREHATQLEAGVLPDAVEGEGRETRARTLFRESWQAYRRAAELMADDPRVVNDAALVQVYHLRDSLGEAEALLERAIALGETRLAALGPEPEERARFPLAQALGDAYLNLGYLHYHVYRQNERARASFERALATDSGERPDVREYLAALDGTRGPVPEPDRGAFVAPPRHAPRERTTVAWEASLAEARERARAEGRALVLYHRGEGLGLAVPYLDELVAGPEFARATRGAVLLVSDALRRTFVERRHDGRRVDCPQYGTVTCGEHVRAHAEVTAWLAELLGSPAGESEEGLWLLEPDADAPVRLQALPELPELVPPPAGLFGEPFEALEASLGGDDGGSEARALASTPNLAARLAIERILWDGFRSSPARGFLLTALAEDRGPEARELLAACVRQCADPELQVTALGVWPEGLETDAVLHAWRWATAPEVRAVAEQVLRRERPSDPVWNARTVLGTR